MSAFRVPMSEDQLEAVLLAAWHLSGEDADACRDLIELAQCYLNSRRKGLDWRIEHES